MALWNRLWNMFRDRRHTDEIDEELRFHLEMRSGDNVAAGMSPGEARSDAQVRFGNLTLEKERARDASILTWLDSLLQDARYTVRSLTSSRAVSALIVTVLALGIGANTAIFSITHAVLLRALPVKDPAGLVNLRVGNFMSWGYIETNESLTYALWQQLAARQDVLTGMFAYSDRKMDVLLNGETRPVVAAYATSEAWKTLGIDAVAGRVFGPSDERDAAVAPVALISYRLWERDFAGDPSAIGRTLLIEGKPFTIAGVLAPRFFGLTVGRTVDVYLPLATEPYIRGKDSAFASGIHYFLTVFGRLRPGLTLDQARARLGAISQLSMQSTVPGELPANVRPKYVKQTFVLRPAASGISYVRTSLQLPLAILSGIVLLLLLLASFTVANLLLARASARQKEIAVRVAIGASRARIVRQLAFESIALALAGAVAGLALSRMLAALLVRAASTTPDPLALDLSLDWQIFGFTCATAILSAVLCGFAPALRAARTAPVDALKGANSSMPLSVMRARRGLLIAQIAITVVLITPAVLFGATLRNLLTADTGLARENVLIAKLDLRRTEVPEKSRQLFYTSVLERMRTLPLVESASLCYVTPISGSSWQFNVRAETAEAWREMHTYYNAVSPEFYATFGTRVLAGRGFTDRDTKGTPAVAVVNAAFARAAFGTTNALGRRVSIALGRRDSIQDSQPLTLEIVGIVQDAKYRNLREDVPPTLYGAFAQDTNPPNDLSVAVRTHGPVTRILRDASSLLTKEYPSVSYQVTTLQTQIDDSVAEERVFTLICVLFGGLALALASVGTYGVLSYFIEQRRPEFAIRLALGATPGNLRRLVYQQSLSALAIGGAAGAVFAVWGAGFTRTLLYGVSPGQPAVYLAVIGIVALIALIATVLPALRASRITSVNSLRCE